MTATISASRIGAMLGVSPFQTPLGLYHELRGEIPHQEDNELLEEGREFEDAIARIACRKYGYTAIDGAIQKEVQRTNDGVTITGHPDRLVHDKDGQRVVMEVKNTLYGTAGEGGWGDPGTDQIPMHYWHQLHTYVWLLGLDYGVLAVRLRGGVVEYRVRFDQQVMDRVIAEAAAFLARVRDGNPPDAKDEEDMRKRWLAQEDKEAVATAEIAATAKALAGLRAQRKEIERQESELATLLLGFAQDASKIVAVTENGIKTVIATLGVDRRFDEARFLADHPDLLARYSRLDTSRLAKEQRKLYDAYMRRPANVHEQKRTIRIKGGES